MWHTRIEYADDAISVVVAGRVIPACVLFAGREASFSLR